jgi:HEAT repeat protein
MCDPIRDVRYQAAIALAWIAPDDNRSLPVLLQLIENDVPTLSDTAASTLQIMGAKAKDAAPGLEHVLAGAPVAKARLRAARSLASTGGETACRPLARASVDDQDPSVRDAAVSAMASLWPDCPEALPALVSRLGQRQWWLANSLAGVGPAAVAPLRNALTSPKFAVRAYSVWALVLMQGFQRPRTATERLVWIPLPPEAVNALVFALSDPSPDLRCAAATALAEGQRRVQGTGTCRATEETKASCKLSFVSPWGVSALAPR